MMVRVPGLTDDGVVTEALTEFVDLFPTLAEAAGLDPIPLCPKNPWNVTLCTEGMSNVGYTYSLLYKLKSYFLNSEN